MRRFNFLFLNLIVVVGLVLGTAPLGLAAIATSPLQPGSVSAASAANSTSERSQGPDLSRRQAKKDHRQKRERAQKKHKQNKNKNKQNKRKQTKRKHQRQNQQRRRANQAQELSTGVLPGNDTVAPPPGQPISARDRYIVRLRQGSGDELQVTKDIAADNAGVVPTHVYRYVFPGFAAVIPPGKLAAVEADPRVEAVVPDQVVHLDAQTLPTGINRIDADQNPTSGIDGVDERVDVDVAVIDTAGNDTHPDLNVFAWGNCTPSHNNSDDNGHGTHVGGTIGALDNGIGVVGVAPGARLWNIRVLVKGSGFSSWIICGVDLATKYATDQHDGFGDVEVANLSLGGSGTDSVCATNPSDLYHQAFCRAVNAGVTVVVAAGNEHVNANTKVPATYDEVITVSALADSDGAPGGLGAATTRGPDDSLADFSNFGADVDIAAPGVAILSTVPTGSCELCDPSGYRLLNGTSMASPHVAGAAALYMANHPTATPAQVKTAILAAKENVHLTNDTDGIDEGVLDVGGSFAAAAAAQASGQSGNGEASKAALSRNDDGKRHGRAKASRQHHPSHKGRMRHRR